MTAAGSSSPFPFAALRRFTQKRVEGERCELCGNGIAEQHQHLIEPANHRLICSCDGCAILFDGPAGRFRRVPRDIQILNDFQITGAQWESLHLPINLAFFYHSSINERVMAMFPSPAGATESLLRFESWEELAAANPVLRELRPDVEALLVNRCGKEYEYARVPIDECFKLVGLIRTHWRGLSGGTEVWVQIAKFSASLKERSSPGEASRA